MTFGRLFQPQNRRGTFADSTILDQQKYRQFDFCICTILLLIRPFWTSKSIVSSIFAYVRYFCWSDQFRSAKVSSVRFLHMYDTFADSTILDQQKYRQFDFCICTILLLIRPFWTSKSIVSSIFAYVRYFC